MKSRLPPPLTWAVALVLLLAGPARAQQHDYSPFGERSGKPISITRQETQNGPRWNVFCEGAELAEVLHALSRKTGLGLEGTEVVPVGAKVSLELRKRPLEQVLEFLLGSHAFHYELGPGTIQILPPTVDPADLLEEARVAWKRLENVGDGEDAVRARIAQGNLAEVRGDLEGAFLIYHELAENGISEETAEATYRAGRVLQQLGHWSEAAQHFRSLASLDEGRRFHARARLELARSSIELGDAKSALHLLNFLASNYPTHDPAELAERRLVRARAHNAEGEYVEALRTLEEGEIVSAPDHQERSLEIRARAFEGLGFDAEAARAWLLYAREAKPAQRAPAFEHAARLALASHDELGALFICREAARSGADQGLDLVAREARTGLGLDNPEPVGILDRLDWAEQLLEQDRVREATPIFEGLYLARGALPALDRARVFAGWSRCVLDRAGLQPALEVLSKARAGFESLEARQRLDVAAAALLELEGLFDQATEAYRGIY
jgi:hypothetical protein